MRKLTPDALSAVGLCCLVLCCLPASTALAHPEGFSGLHVTIDGDRVRAVVTVHTRDLGDWFPPARYTDYVAEVTGEMERSGDELIELQVDGQPQPIVAIRAFLLEVGLIEIDIDYPLPATSQAVELLVWSKHLIHLPPGHQQLLYVEDRRQVAADAPQGLIRLDDALSIERDAGAVILPPVPGRAVAKGESRSGQLPPSPAPQIGDSPREPKASPALDRPSSRISFFVFGVEHILGGYDHLLFLAALLLACAKFSQAAAIITCFTVAHSITLALAALDVVRLSGDIVEPLIALSIVFVAVENLWSEPALGRRVAITSGFGLVHGLGFASALREIGVGSVPGGVVLPLLQFNLGVEAGQLCVAAVLLPLLWWARRRSQVSRILVPAGSLLVAAAGAYWLVTRLAAP
jgi:hydrogenase/urease accessory protein HupE